MGTIQARYDASAASYRIWWEPVLAPSALALLDRLDHATDVRDILDVGTGTGILAIESVRRWPRARVAGLDGSDGMLGVAAAEADRRLDADERTRLTLVAGHAGRLPFTDRSFDLVVSSFVLQLVPDRPAALREALRVLRPGGRLALVSWLATEERFAPDEAFEKALDELDLDEEVEAEEARSVDFVSPAAVAAQLRRAGFERVGAQPSTLVHGHRPERYLDFLAEYAEAELFGTLEPMTRQRLRARTQARLDRLPPEAFTWRVPIVFALGRRPPD